MNAPRRRLFRPYRALRVPCRAGALAIVPRSPVRTIVLYPARGSVDAVSRIVAEKLQEIWGNPLIIEDIVGAAGMSGRIRCLLNSSAWPV